MWPWPWPWPLLQSHQLVLWVLFSQRQLTFNLYNANSTELMDSVEIIAFLCHIGLPILNILTWNFSCHIFCIFLFLIVRVQTTLLCCVFPADERRSYNAYRPTRRDKLTGHNHRFVRPTRVEQRHDGQLRPVLHQHTESMLNLARQFCAVVSRSTCLVLQRSQPALSCSTTQHYWSIRCTANCSLPATIYTLIPSSVGCSRLVFKPLKGATFTNSSEYR